MATRSAIIMKTVPSPGEVVIMPRYEGIYCHSDGGLWGVGGTLFDHYQDPEKIQALIDLGDLSYLGDLVDPDPEKGQHRFGGPRQKGVTLAYGRDRGETRVGKKKSSCWGRVKNKIDHQFCYIWEDGVWYFCDDGEDVWKPLQPALEIYRFNNRSQEEKARDEKILSDDLDQELLKQAGR